MPWLLLLDKQKRLDSCGHMQGVLSKSKRSTTTTTSNTTSCRARPRNPTITHLPNLLTDRDERPIRPKRNWKILLFLVRYWFSKIMLSTLLGFPFICLRVSPQQPGPCPCWLFQTPSTIVTGPPLGVADDTKVVTARRCGLSFTSTFCRLTPARLACPRRPPAFGDLRGRHFYHRSSSLVYVLSFRQTLGKIN